MKRWIGMVVGLVVVALIVFGAVWACKHFIKKGPNPLVENSNYVTDLPARVVAKVADNLGLITRIQLTPDNSMMFVTTLPGTVWVLTLEDGRYVKQTTPLYQMNLGWDEGAENGMTGVIVSAGYASNNTIFLTYAKSTNGKTGQNQILKLVVEKDEDTYIGRDAGVIFTANVPAGGAHQIQGGMSFRIEDELHLIFAIGDNYRAAEALDMTKESGKIMLIQESGANPLGPRPYPNYPKVQVPGIRNAYSLMIDTENGEWVYWTENGAEAHDRIVYAPILDATKQFSGNWNGKDESLTTLSLNGEKTGEYMAKVWDGTVAPTDIIGDTLGRFYVNIFSSSQDSTKQILMGEKDREGKWNLKPIVTRKPNTPGGNLLGLTMSAKGDFYFGDFGEGDLYVLTKVWNKQARVSE